MKKAYDVAGIPTLFILDKEGKIRYKHIGYRPDLDEIWEKQIAELQKSAKVKSK
jgi:thioredoxin-related protein